MSVISQQNRCVNIEEHLQNLEKESPYRNRSVEENLELFENMRAGKYADGGEGASCKDRHGITEYEHA